VPAPLYNDDEIAKLIGLRKTVTIHAWNHGDPSRDGLGRVVRLNCPEDPKALFQVELHPNPEAETVAILLKVETPGRESQAIVRYDIQDEEHENPRWFMPRIVTARAPHAHVYNARAVKKGLRWDQCASPLLKLTKNSPERVLTRFMEDMDIEQVGRAGELVFEWFK